MSKWFLSIAGITLMATVCAAAPPALSKETQDDIARHRAIAAAHEAAARCLEAGKKDETCEKELEIACKGLAIGRFCGMKH